jgi:hypothetical protein
MYLVEADVYVTGSTLDHNNDVRGKNIIGSTGGGAYSATRMS